VDCFGKVGRGLPALDKLFEKEGSERPALKGLLEALKTRGAFWSLAAGIYKRGC
jgi:hypothetical protein